MIVSCLPRSKLNIEFSNKNHFIAIKKVSRYRFFGRFLQLLNFASSIKFLDSKEKTKTVFINTNSLIKRMICLNQGPLPTKKTLSKKAAQIRKNSPCKLRKLDEASIRVLFNKIVQQPAVQKKTAAVQRPNVATVPAASLSGNARQDPSSSPAPKAIEKPIDNTHKQSIVTGSLVVDRVLSPSNATPDAIPVKPPVTHTTTEIKPQEFAKPSAKKYQYHGPRDENGLPSGRGELRTTDGKRLIYKGSFTAGKYEGEGIYFYKNGTRYEGQISNNHRHGNGSLFDDHNKLLYSGNFEKDKKHGDGYLYEGSKCFKVVHEAGILKKKVCISIRAQVANFILPNKNSYYGELIDGLPDGEGGVEYNSAGTIYKGEWKKGLYDGEGILTNPDGSHWNGMFENGLVHGRAKWTSPSKEYYDGECAFGKRHGNGFWWSPKGDQYNGEFKYGKFDGQGVYTFKSGNVFKGTFSNGLKVNGEMQFKKGDIYQGGYNVKQKKHGKGHWFCANKNQWYAVEYDNGKQIRKNEITKVLES